MKTLAFVAMILASAALSSTASARNYTIHGTICRPDPANIGVAEYDQYGVHNTSTTAALTVECPLPLTYPESGAPPALTLARVTVYDRSTTAGVSCLLENVTVDGNLMLSLFNKTSGRGPGSGPFDFAFAFLPSGPDDASGVWRFRCKIPPVEAGAFSHVVSAFVPTVE
jgi:hypothetical protein